MVGGVYCVAKQQTNAPSRRTLLGGYFVKIRFNYDRTCSTNRIRIRYLCMIHDGMYMYREKCGMVPGVVHTVHTVHTWDERTSQQQGQPY
jgi:hypothetical protein